jgi:hypothetical protein
MCQERNIVLQLYNLNRINPYKEASQKSYMKKLYSITSYEGMAVRFAKPLQRVEGIVREAELTTGRNQGTYKIPLNGLDIKIACKDEIYVFPNANFRVNSGERVRIYAKDLGSKMNFKPVQGLQILDPENGTVIFQYKDCKDCNTDENFSFLTEAEAAEINK